MGDPVKPYKDNVFIAEFPTVREALEYAEAEAEIEGIGEVEWEEKENMPEIKALNGTIRVDRNEEGEVELFALTDTHGTQVRLTPGDAEKVVNALIATIVAGDPDLEHSPTHTGDRQARSLVSQRDISQSDSPLK